LKISTIPLYLARFMRHLAKILKILKNLERVFQDYAQIWHKPLVSLPNKPEKWLQVYSGFSGFSPRKKDIVSSELVLHLKNIQCDR